MFKSKAKSQKQKLSSLSYILPSIVGVSSYALYQKYNESIDSSLYTNITKKYENSSVPNMMSESVKNVIKYLNFDSEAEWEGQQFDQNVMKGRVQILQYPANSPCEDAFQAYQFKEFKGYYAAVFDGHGGWQVSNYAMKKLHVRRVLLI